MFSSLLFSGDGRQWMLPYKFQVKTYHLPMGTLRLGSNTLRVAMQDVSWRQGGLLKRYGFLEGKRIKRLSQERPGSLQTLMMTGRMLTWFLDSEWGKLTVSMGENFEDGVKVEDWVPSRLRSEKFSQNPRWNLNIACFQTLGWANFWNMLAQSKTNKPRFLCVFLWGRKNITETSFLKATLLDEGEQEMVQQILPSAVEPALPRRRRFFFRKMLTKAGSSQQQQQQQHY